MSLCIFVSFSLDEDTQWAIVAKKKGASHFFLKCAELKKEREKILEFLRALHVFYK